MLVNHRCARRQNRFADEIYQAGILYFSPLLAVLLAPMMANNELPKVAQRCRFYVVAAGVIHKRK
ncbi:hypothetical protein KCP78_23435 [Salmonella enterica subsp. enterica]|nr:hypothetical protein KCP78_23435 [Salmonella enterica subsp. enterica]